MNYPLTSSHDAEDQDISLLFSPTKARQAALESQSWKHVTSRLTTILSPHRVPRFERNDATLKALLELVKANEDADEERRLLREACVEVLTYLPKDGKGEGVRGNLLQKLENGLSKEGKDALHDLSTSAVLLSCSSGTVSEMESRITDLTLDTFDASNDLLNLEQTQQQFERESKAIEQTIANFKAETERIDTEAMQSQTSVCNRETKVVGMKLAEYQERIKTLERCGVGNVRIEDVLKKEKVIEESQQELQRLEGRIVDMNSLPPDLDVSRMEVERARNELEEWKRRRDGAFEGLVE